MRHRVGIYDCFVRTIVHAQEMIASKPELPDMPVPKDDVIQGMPKPARDDSFSYIVQ